MQEKLKIIKYYMNGCSGCCFLDNALMKLYKLAAENNIELELVFHNVDILGKLPDEVTDEHELMPQFIFYYKGKKDILKGSPMLKTPMSLIKENGAEDNLFEIVNNLSLWFLLGFMGAHKVAVDPKEKETWICKEARRIGTYIDEDFPFLCGNAMVRLNDERVEKERLRTQKCI